MGALIGLVVQLTLMAISLTITLLIWMARLTVMLIAALVGAMSTARE